MHCYREKEREDKRGSGVGFGRAGPSVAAAVLSSPHCSSGGFPESPAVLNKGQSSTRQSSKTCYFPSLPSNAIWNFERAGRRLLIVEFSVNIVLNDEERQPCGAWFTLYCIELVTSFVVI